MALRYPPSTSKSPVCSSRTGGNMPSMVIDARTYLHTVPDVCVLSPPDVRLVLTQKNESQRSSMSVSPSTVRSIRSTPFPEKMDSTGSVRSVNRCRGDDKTPTSSLTRGSMCVVDACLA